ncbi:MAG: peptidoglycan recognition protein family protein [Armatimonadota bacterium]
MRPKAIVVHLSASRWGDAATFREWHLARGWSDIGYHAVILNGRRGSNLRYNPKLDGKIEPGRPESEQGAHCKAGGMNAKALGVCLVGTPGWRYPTPAQERALVHYLAVKCREYGIPVSAITQHSDHEPGKPFCASLDMKRIRKAVAEKLSI